MNKTFILSTIFLLFFILPPIGQSTHAPLEMHKGYPSESLRKSEQELKHSQKLNWKQRLVLKIIEKKMAKRAQKAEENKEVYAGAPLSFGVAV